MSGQTNLSAHNLFSCFCYSPVFLSQFLCRCFFFSKLVLSSSNHFCLRSTVSYISYHNQVIDFSRLTVHQCLMIEIHVFTLSEKKVKIDDVTSDKYFASCLFKYRKMTLLTSFIDNVLMILIFMTFPNVQYIISLLRLCPCKCH